MVHEAHRGGTSQTPSCSVLAWLLLSGPCAYRHSVVSSCKEGPSCPTNTALLQMLALRSPSCVCVCMHVCMHACLPACVGDMAFPCRAEHFSLHIVCLCFHHQLPAERSLPDEVGEKHSSTGACCKHVRTPQMIEIPKIEGETSYYRIQEIRVYFFHYFERKQIRI